MKQSVQFLFLTTVLLRELSPVSSPDFKSRGSSKIKAELPLDSGMVSQPPLCFDQAISDMHTGLGNPGNRTRTGRLVTVEQHPDSELLSPGLPALAQHVCWTEQGD